MIGYYDRKGEPISPLRCAHLKLAPGYLRIAKDRVVTPELA